MEVKGPQLRRSGVEKRMLSLPGAGEGFVAVGEYSAGQRLIPAAPARVPWKFVDMSG